MDLDQYLKLGTVITPKETYAVVKSKKTYEDAFANVVDRFETTVIIEESKYNKNDAIDYNGGWRLFTLDLVFSFDSIGVTAKISRKLADYDISIIPLASYSRDHFLIKEENFEKSINAFKELGIDTVLI